MRAGGPARRGADHPHTTCPASLTALSRSASAQAAPRPRSASTSPAISTAWTPASRLAPAVLIALLMLTTGCFNPFFIGQAQPKQNHVPVVEVFPEPSNIPIPVNLGGACESDELNIVAFEDADLEPLTARYDLLRTVQGSPKRTLLRQFQAVSPLDGVYTLPPDVGRLPLDSGTFGGLNFEDDTQLVELRVSDSGFGTNAFGVPVPDDGGGVFFMSWVIRIGDCPVGP